MGSLSLLEWRAAVALCGHGVPQRTGEWGSPISSHGWLSPLPALDWGHRGWGYISPSPSLAHGNQDSQTHPRAV